MRHIFDFVDNYSTVTYGMRDTLQLIRKDDNDALFSTAAAGAGKVVLFKLALSVPMVYTRVLQRIMSVPYRFVCVNVKRSLYLKHGVSSAPENLDGYWLHCKRTRVVKRKITPLFLIAVTLRICKLG